MEFLSSDSPQRHFCNEASVYPDTNFRNICCIYTDSINQAVALSGTSVKLYLEKEVPGTNTVDEA